MWIGQTLSLLVLFLFRNPARGATCRLFFSPVHVHLSLIILWLWACFCTSPSLHHPSFPWCFSCSTHSALSPTFLRLLPSHFSFSSFYFFPLLLPFSSTSPTALPLLFPILLHPSPSLPPPSGISLWRWIWSQCVSTATNACRTTWNTGWPSANATQKRRRRNHWYPCVCDPLFLLSPHFHCSPFGQFPSPLLSMSMLHCHHNMLRATFLPILLLY